MYPRESVSWLTIIIVVCRRAVEEGWVSAPFSRAVVSELGAGTVGIQEARAFKANATNIIQEYFLSSDISEVITSLEDLAAPDYHAAFVKRLILLALDRYVPGLCLLANKIAAV